MLHTWLWFVSMDRQVAGQISSTLCSKDAVLWLLDWNGFCSALQGHVHSREKCHPRIRYVHILHLQLSVLFLLRLLILWYKWESSMEILYSYVCFGPLCQAQFPMLSRSSEKYISLILPAYNEEARLSITLDEMLGYGFLDLILHFHVMFLRKCFCCCNNFAVLQVMTSLDEQ